MSGDAPASGDPFAGQPFPSELEPDAFRFRWDELPLATPDLPGTGGTLRAVPEDFEVVELPSYLPSGEGSHLYLDVRKRGRTTKDVVDLLAAAGVPRGRIGVAGLKDKHAVTRQWISVPNRFAEESHALDDHEGIEVLERRRHKNKLGMGHLRGNRFTIRLRGVEVDAAARAAAVLEQLAAIGVPNYFGPQRFGRFGTNAADGLRVVREQEVPGGHRLRRFFVSALQSLLANRMLAERMRRGLYRTVLVGDWAKKHDTGGEFEVREAAEAPRAERLEISAMLPLYGTRVRPSAGTPGEIEAEILARHGLAWSDFTSRRGARRVSRVVADDVVVDDVSVDDAAVEDASIGDSGIGAASVEATGEGAASGARHELSLRLTFALPKGSYATTLLREVTKRDVDAPIDADDSDPAD